MSYEWEDWPLLRFMEATRKCIKAADFCRLTGVPRSTLQGWLDRGHLEFITLQEKKGSLVLIPLDQNIKIYHSPRVMPLPDKVCHNWPTGTDGATRTKRRPRGRAARAEGIAGGAGTVR